MSFWRPGAPQPGAPDGDVDEALVPASAGYNPRASLPADVQRRSLPVFAHRQEILFAVEHYGVVVVVGETGCGKSTQIPQYLLEAGWCSDGKMIGITQPRRVAAASLAARVAEETASPVGSLVGYAVRFDEQCDLDKTRIKYMTDGLLLREMLLDPLLSQYSVIVVDEAHERSLNSDLLVGLLKKIRAARPSLRLIISSATLDAERFRRFFDVRADQEAKDAHDAARQRPSGSNLSSADAHADDVDDADVVLDEQGNALSGDAAAAALAATRKSTFHIGRKTLHAQGRDAEAADGEDADSDATPEHMDDVPMSDDDSVSRSGGNTRNGQSKPFVEVVIAPPSQAFAHAAASSGPQQSDPSIGVPSGPSKSGGTETKQRSRSREKERGETKHKHRSRDHSSSSESDSGSSRSRSRHRGHRKKHSKHDKKDKRRHGGRKESSSRGHRKHHKDSKREHSKKRHRSRSSTSSSSSSSSSLSPSSTLKDKSSDTALTASALLPASNAPSVLAEAPSAVPLVAITASSAEAHISAAPPTSSPVAPVVAQPPSQPPKRSRWGAVAPPPQPPPAASTAANPFLSASGGAPAPLIGGVVVRPGIAPLPPAPLQSGAAVTAQHLLRSAVSATTSPPPAPAPLARQLDRSVIIPVEGRAYPVDVLYREAPCGDVVTSAAEVALNIHLSEGPGDVLIFLPGAEEVERCCALVRDNLPDALMSAGVDVSAEEAACDVYPLYAGLPWSAQLTALEPGRVTKRGRPVRKVIVATTIAETSLTIDGIGFVIDGGLVRMPCYDPVTGVDALLTVPESKAQAAQRAGRAGRIARGKCFRLFAEAAYSSMMPDRAPPEGVRCDLSPGILSLLALGVRDVAHFDFIDPPSPLALKRALELLHALGAIDGGCKLTVPVGLALADLPVDPRTGAMLLAALRYGCAEQVVTIAAMTQQGAQNVWIGWRPAASKQLAVATDLAAAAFAVKEGDHMTLLNVYRGYEASGRSAAWCKEHCLAPAALQRASEIRAQLRAALSALVARERARRQQKAEEDQGGGNGAAAAAADADQDGSASWTLVTSPDLEEDVSGDIIRKCVLSGFFINVARLSTDGRTYVTLKDKHAATLHPSSVLSRFGLTPSWVLYGEAVWAGSSSGSSDGTADTSALQLRHVSAINPLWLLEVAKRYYVNRSGVDGASVDAPLSAAAPAPAPAPAKLAYKSAAERAAERKKAEEDEAAAAAEATRRAALQRERERQQAEADDLAIASSSFSSSSAPAAGGGHKAMNAGVAAFLGAIFGDTDAVATAGTRTASVSYPSSSSFSAVAARHPAAVGAAPPPPPPPDPKQARKAREAKAQERMKELFDFGDY